MMRYTESLLLVVSLCLFAGGSQADEPTTVPIFLPYYATKSWSRVRGSIITSDASETTYTVFCAPQTTPSCNLALDFPFVFAEGNNTLRFEGTQTSTYTANLGCSLAGTTEAACSAYSSLKSGFTVGPHTGPTEISWTSTLSGSEVEWGVLTLAESPTNTNNGAFDEIANSALSTGADARITDDFLFDGTIPASDTVPTETDVSAGSSLSRPALLASSLSALALAALLS